MATLIIDYPSSTTGDWPSHVMANLNLSYTGQVPAYRIREWWFLGVPAEHLPEKLPHNVRIATLAEIVLLKFRIATP